MPPKESRGRVRAQTRRRVRHAKIAQGSARKIAIVGSNPDTWEKVPEGDGWEIWRFSRRNYESPPKPDKWFELHHPRNYQRYEAVKPGYIQFLKDVGAVTYGDFPFDELLNEFGSFFFSGGQAPWLMAYAITQKPKMIGLWGINPAGDYKPQLSEVHHFVQIARDRGIEVISPEDPNPVTPRPLYAREMDFGHGDAMRAIFIHSEPNGTGRSRPGVNK